MEEAEVKILEIDRVKIESTLISLGAKKVFDGEMSAVYLDRNGGVLKERGDLLRVRKEGDMSVITFKKYVSDEPAKIRKEFEVSVSDFDAAREIFQYLGFKEWLIVNKHRTSYELEDVHFEFDKYRDTYEYIPEFLEIEAGDIHSIYHFVDSLGLRKEDCKPWTFIEVARYYETR